MRPGRIKNLLVESFQRSLDYDRDLLDGAAAYQSGDFERYIAQGLRRRAALQRRRGRRPSGPSWPPQQAARVACQPAVGDDF
jgi:hypothetical protein